MQEVIRSVIVPYSVQEMFALASDVAKYQEFLPWCSESQILERANGEALARVGISYKGWRTTFTTRNRMIPSELIEMRLVEGAAFSALTGDWRFKALDDLACQVELEVHFSLAGKLGSRVLSPVFSRICAELVDAFVERAKVLYGERAIV